jgi:RNA polymerase sigma-70 factor (ECF subfamily)
MFVRNDAMDELTTVTPSDQQLMTQLKEGDLEALGALYERHWMPVFRTLLAVTRDPAAAEDILQDCFLRLHRFSGRFDTRRPFRPWLYRMAVNLAYSWAARADRWETPADDLLEWVPCPDDICPERKVELNELNEQVLEAVAALSFPQSSTMALYYLNSCSLKEIATLLDCPVGTVKSRLYYGRESLQRMMAVAPEVNHARS